MKPQLPKTTTIIRSVDKMASGRPHLKGRTEQDTANAPSLLSPWINMQLGLACDDRRVLVDSEK